MKRYISLMIFSALLLVSIGTSVFFALGKSTYVSASIDLDNNTCQSIIGGGNNISYDNIAMVSGVYCNVDWSIDGGVLTIGKVGEIQIFENVPERSSSSYPWGEYKNSITEVKFEGMVMGYGGFQYMFSGCANLTKVNLNNFNTFCATKLDYMFADCIALVDIDISMLDLSNVMSIKALFKGCTSLENITMDLIDTSNVTDMSRLFYDCTNLASIDLRIDTHNVTNMSEMFSGCSKLVSADLSHIDTSKVTDMKKMFNGCTQLTDLDIQHFDTSSVTNMSNMFAECSSIVNIYLEHFVAPNLTDVSKMFLNCPKLVCVDMPNLSTPSLSNMSEMFKGCSDLVSINIESLNNSNVLSNKMNNVFSGCVNLSAIKLGPNFSFKNTTSYLINNAWYCVANRIEYSQSDLNQYDSAKAGWLIKKTSYTDDQSFGLDWAVIGDVLLVGKSGETQTLSSSAPWSAQAASISVVVFAGTINMPSSISSTFAGMTALKYVDFGSVNASSLTSAQSMFSNCTSLYSVNMSRFNTSNCDADYMFNGCTSLRVVDISRLNTTSTATGMFSGCNNIKHIKLGNNYSFHSSNNGLASASWYCVSNDSKYLSTNVLASAYNNNSSTMSGWIDRIQYPTVTFDLDGGAFSSAYISRMGVYLDTNTLYVESAELMLPNIDDISKSGYRFDGWIMGDNVLPSRIDNISQINVKAIWTPVTSNVIDSGTYDGVDYKIVSYSDDEYVLELGLSGATQTYTNVSRTVTDYPWDDYRDNITKVLFKGVVVGQGGAQYIFSGMNNVESFDISLFDLSSVTSIKGMFAGCTGIKQFDITNTDISAVTDISSLFDGDTSLEYVRLDLIGGNITATYDMFNGCSNLHALDFVSFDTSKVVNMSRMYKDCTSFESISGIADLSYDSVEDMSEMFCNDVSIVSVVAANFNITTNDTLIDISSMFAGCTGLVSVELTNLNTTNVTDMSKLFKGCTSLVTVDITSFDTSSVEDMSEMFESCTAIVQIDLDDFDTSSVTDFSDMFKYCSSIETLALPFDTSVATSVKGMFEGCLALEDLDISTFDLTGIVAGGAEKLFADCDALARVVLGDKFRFYQDTGTYADSYLIDDIWLCDSNNVKYLSAESLALAYNADPTALAGVFTRSLGLVITFDLDGGTLSQEYIETYHIVDNKMIVERNTAITLPSANNISRDYYVMNRLSYNGETYSGNIIPDKDMTFVVGWDKIIYNIRYHVMSGGPNVTNGNVKTYTVGEGTISISELTHNDYVFHGWYERQDYTGDTVSTISAVNPRDIDLYAYWTIVEYEVSFNTLGGSIIDSQSVRTGGRVSKPNDPTKDHYDFVCWCIDAELSNVYSFNTAVRESMTLYARWEPKTYYVTFDTNGADEIDTQQVKYGNKVIEPEAPLNDEKYTFNGWFIDEFCTTKFNFDTIIDGNITLYAGWAVAKSPSWLSGNGLWIVLGIVIGIVIVVTGMSIWLNYIIKKNRYKE